MTEAIHLPVGDTSVERGASLVALCDRYRADHLTGHDDPRHSRFTTSEDEITCAYCLDRIRHLEDARVKAHLAGERVAPEDAPPFVAGPAYAVAPQQWQHPEIEARSRRGEEIERPAFVTWRSAIRVLTAIKDEGAGVKSSSDPSRFEALPVGTSETPEGDRAQREAGRLAWVARALDGAFTEAFVVTTFPVRLTLHAMLCREILIGRVVGRAVQACPVLGCEGGSRCDKRKHRRVLSRREWPAAELGEHVSEAMRVSAEWPAGMITAGIVNAITAEGGRAIEADLMRRGLVSHRDGGLHRAEAADMVADDGRLRGWKQIADWLGVHEATAREYVKWDPPLPVYKFGAQVEADPDEMKAWRAVHTKRVGASG